MIPEININELKYSILTDEDLQTLRRLKTILVKSQLYAEAAILRDLEKRMMQIIELGKHYGFPTERSLERWRKELHDGNRFYTKEDLNSLVELTSKPLRDALVKYEESVRVLIDKNITALITQIHENDASTQERMLAFGQYILENYSPFHFITAGEPKLAYRLKRDAGDWDGEPSRVYTTQEVYNTFVVHLIVSAKKKIEEEKTPVSVGAHWVYDEMMTVPNKVNFKCEHDGCPETQGRDYKRVPMGSSMDTQPIFLCDKHSTGFEPFTT